MGPCLLLAVLTHGHAAHKTPVSGSMFWEELAYVQAMKMGKYMPMIRFGCWDIIRYPKAQTYMFVTPYFVQEGTFRSDGVNYSFHAVMANELGNADVAKIKADMNPQAAAKFALAYAQSMIDFTGTYDKSNGVLKIAYPVKGMLTPFELHMTTEGDDGLASVLADGERGIAGLWHAPDPPPELLDAKTQYKIGGLEGLERFVTQAIGADGSEFGIVDFRVDHTFRIHDKIGNWSKSGSTVRLTYQGKVIMVLTMSADGKLLSGGKLAYVCN
ncbi:MAG TPA: hypothetical protein VG944_11260 [Fimbriimonas sp.]|nr:hypothetical protein [Fimbriimonas sp.]